MARGVFLLGGHGLRAGFLSNGEPPALAVESGGFIRAGRRGDSGAAADGRKSRLADRGSLERRDRDVRMSMGRFHEEKRTSGNPLVAGLADGAGLVVLRLVFSDASVAARSRHGTSVCPDRVSLAAYPVSSCLFLALFSWSVCALWESRSVNKARAGVLNVK